MLETPRKRLSTTQRGFAVGAGSLLVHALLISGLLLLSSGEEQKLETIPVSLISRSKPTPPSIKEPIAAAKPPKPAPPKKAKPAPTAKDAPTPGKRKKTAPKIAKTKRPNNAAQRASKSTSDEVISPPTTPLSNSDEDDIVEDMAPWLSTHDPSKHAATGSWIWAELLVNRIRKTSLGLKIERVLAPMPDFRSLVRANRLPWLSMFDHLVISTSDPRFVFATSLATKSKKPGKARAALTGTDTKLKIDWKTTPDFDFGHHTQHSGFHPRDPRTIYAKNKWMLLTAPLTNTTTTAISAQLRHLEKQQKTLPANPELLAIVALARQTAFWSIPQTDIRVPSPALTKITLEEKSGFLLTGVLTFDSEDDAQEFANGITKARQKLLSQFTTKFLLQQVGMQEILRDATWTTSNSSVIVHSQMSETDANHVLNMAERWSNDWFGRIKH